MFSFKYKTIKQIDYKDCGAACVAMILKKYKSQVSLAKIREIAGTSETGTNALGIVKSLQFFGFQTKAIKANMDIFEDQSLPYPAIAHILKNERLLHYVVIHNVTKKYLIISDPEDGLKKVTKEEFKKEWTGVVFFTIPDETYTPINDKENAILNNLKILFIDKTLIFHIVISSMLIIVIGIVTSFYFQSLIDSIIPQGTLGTLNIISIGLIIAYVFNSIFDYIKNYLLANLGNRMSIRIMLSYYKHVIRLPMDFFSTRKSGEIISRFMDANKVIDALASVTLTIILDFSMVFIVGIVLFFQNTTLFFITLASVPIYSLIILTFIKMYEKSNKDEMESNSILNSYILESLNGIETIKACRAEQEASDRTDRLFADSISSSFKTFNIDNAQQFLKQTTKLVSSGIILWIGARLVINGDFSIGQLITFNSLIVYFSDPLQNIINLQPKIQTAKVASDRLNEVMIIKKESNDDEINKISSLSIFERNIELKELSFNYKMKKNILEDINFSIQSGEKVAFVGRSGSGKSTLAKLLVSFYEPSEGKILYNDCDVKDISKFFLRDNVTLVPQVAFFFSGTIIENLTFGIGREVNLEELIEVCKKAKIHEFINDQPMRYSTYVEENASNLSGGQKQRLAIARALLRKSKALILDEATSSIDSITEKEIIEELFKEDFTLIIIAHRLSVLKECSQIFVLENTRIVERGTHQELLGNESSYFKLWDA